MDFQLQQITYQRPNQLSTRGQRHWSDRLHEQSRGLRWHRRRPRSFFVAKCHAYHSGDNWSSDSSGTTFIIEGYLIKSGIWKYPQSKSWPSAAGGTFLAGLGNQAVATDILTTPYSMGYVEVAYSLQNNMSVAFVQNKDRSSFVEPTLANITAAVSNADASSLPTGLQDWSGVSLILEPGANSYPIVSFTYILVYQQLNVRPLMTLDKAKALIDFIWYMVHEGQSAGTSLDYATLPQSIVTIDETSIKSITYNGQSLPT